MSNRLNFILIIIDSARADHFSCYGYSKKTTPYIDELSEEAMVFESAFSTSCWTPPSCASILTGKYPSQHGVLGYSKNLITGKGKFGENLYLSKNNTTIPEILRKNGYKTLGLSHSPHVSKKRGFDKGFDVFIEYYTKPLLSANITYLQSFFYNLILGSDSRAFLVNNIVKKWLNKNHKYPFFIFINYCNTHVPYNPPFPYRKKRGNKKLRKFSKIIYHCLTKKIKLDKNDLEVLKSWYDEELRYLDYRINELIKYLKKLDLYDNTVIIITSDHGECFGEHGLVFHGYGLYDELIRVPLIINCPSIIKKGRKIRKLVSLVDIFPTILDVCELNTNLLKNLPGKSLLKKYEKHEYIIAERGKFEYFYKIFKKAAPDFDPTPYIVSMKCLRTLRYKYIARSSGKEELYDLKKDKNENINLVKKLPGIREKMVLMLKKWENSIERPKFEWAGNIKIREVIKKLRLRKSRIFHK